MLLEDLTHMEDTWKRADPLPHPLHHTAATSFDGKIYVVGGFLDSQWTPSNRLFIYDPLKNQWHESKQMPTARGALTANFINGIYIMLLDKLTTNNQKSCCYISTQTFKNDPTSPEVHE
jgi:N-acetylneuraminic acid mutarotase